MAARGSLAHLTPPRAQILRAVHSALVEDAEAEIALALRVAVLTAMGVSQAEIMAKTGATMANVRQAVVRLRRAADGLCGQG